MSKVGWKFVKLSDICVYETSKVPVSELNTENYISTENMLSDRGGVTSASTLPNVEYATRFSKNQTLLSNIRPYFKKLWIANKEGGCSNDILCFKLNSGIDPLFFYYQLSQDSFFDFVMAGSKGTKMPRGDKQHIMQFNFSLPAFEVQKKIADILSSLDDKIELNNQINANLEQQAQAIFKSWFMDFEPFKDGEFIESELGLIPKEWKVGCINDLIEKSISGDWGKDALTDNYNQEVFCIRGADIPEVVKGNIGKMPTRYILSKNFDSKQLGENDLVIEISGGSPTQSTGRIALITNQLLERFNKPMICTNFCKALKPKENWSYFVFYFWQYLNQQNVMFSYENGTTGIKNLDINSLTNNEQTVIPSKKIISDFNLLMNQISSIIFNIGLQNEKLAETRDSLLPKLMNGEFDL